MELQRLASLFPRYGAPSYSCHNTALNKPVRHTNSWPQPRSHTNPFTENGPDDPCGTASPQPELRHIRSSRAHTTSHHPTNSPKPPPSHNIPAIHPPNLSRPLCKFVTGSTRTRTAEGNCASSEMHASLAWAHISFSGLPSATKDASRPQNV